jgi:RNA polymerase sigma-70 factor, ECF subfamily
VIVQVLLRERLRVTALATAIVRDAHTADDIFQQVVLSALEAKSQFREVNHVLAWALRAARHRALDLARDQHLCPLPDQILDLFESPVGNPAESAWSDWKRCSQTIRSHASGFRFSWPKPWSLLNVPRVRELHSKLNRR